MEQLVEERIREFLRRLGPALDSETRLHELFVRQVERPLVKVVLEATAGNQIRAAAILGIHRNTLRKKIAELGLAPKARKRKGRDRMGRRDGRPVILAFGGFDRPGARAC